MKRILHAAITIRLTLVGSTHAAYILVNPNFESGNLAGWSTANGGSGGWFTDNPGTTTPSSGRSTAGNGAGGSYYAVTDQSGPGVHILYQTFSVSGGGWATLSYQMFANNWSGTTVINPAGLTTGSGNNQHARVDILTGAANPYSTSAGLLANYYLGADAGGNPHAYTTYNVNLSTLLAGGGSFMLRFAEVDNLGLFNLGVDNVYLDWVANTAPIAVLTGLSPVTLGSGTTLYGTSSFDANLALGDVLSYAWDLDADGQFDDATSASSTLSSTFLSSLGVGNHTIRLRVTDTRGLASIAQGTLEINAPAAVPEPTTALLWLVGGLVVLRYGRGLRVEGRARKTAKEQTES